MPYTDPKIHILTGPVHSGKSGKLWEFLSGMRTHGWTVSGLLNPSINGQKWFVHLETGIKFHMETVDDSRKTIKVGKYTFSSESFARARAIITERIVGHCDLFIIDELGKLELNGKGLEPAISEFLNRLTESSIEHVIIVIRDYLVADAQRDFDLEEARIISVNDLVEEKWIIT